jgi:plasmid stabilization system protein ParE
MIIEWDTADKREVEAAKEYYRKARAEGRTITDLNGDTIFHFRPSSCGFIIKEKELNDAQFAVRVFDESGDRRIIWNMHDPEQLREAAKLFKEYLAKGWRAYAVDETGKSKRRIVEFSSDNEEILFKDIAVSDIAANFGDKIQKETEAEIVTKAEKIANFLSSFRNTKLVPRTYPG